MVARYGLEADKFGSVVRGFGESNVSCSSHLRSASILALKVRLIACYLQASSHLTELMRKLFQLRGLQSLSMSNASEGLRDLVIGIPVEIIG